MSILLVLAAAIQTQAAPFTMGIGYQGFLKNETGPVNGVYDFSFTLLDQASGGNAVAGSITNTSVVVNEGVFRVTLDFGSSAFDGTVYWLESAVRTNGGTDFTTLAPRQPLLATPYAFYALTAGNATKAASADSVAAANISGTIGLAQLPAEVLTNHSAAVHLGGTFSGDGSGLTNLNLTTVTIGLTQLPAQVLTTNSTNVTLSGVFTGDGSGLTNLNANSIIASLSGTWRTNAGQIGYDNTASGVAGQTVQAALDQALTNSLAWIPRVVMPSTLTAVVGDELQIFVRGVVEAQEPYALPYLFNCAKGASYPRYWDYTPAPVDVGTSTLGVSVLNEAGFTLASNCTTVTIVGPGQSPSSNICVLCLGDSLTAAGVWPAEFYRRLTQTGGEPAGKGWTNVQFVGDHPMTPYSTQFFMGYPGWTLDDYMGTATNSASWIVAEGHDKTSSDIGSVWGDANGNRWSLMQIAGSTLKIGTYGGAVSSWEQLPASCGVLTNSSGGAHTAPIIFTAATPTIQSPLNCTNGFSFAGAGSAFGWTNISVCYVLLGWNTVMGFSSPRPYVTNWSSYLVSLTTFATQLRADYPNAMLRIVGIQVPSPTGGLGANYGATGLKSQYYQVLRTVNGLNLALDQWCSTNAFSRFVAVAPQFDSDYNMATVPVPVNTRSTVTEARGSNGVHPATGGYYQIADAVWRDFVRTFCQ